MILIHTFEIMMDLMMIIFQNFSSLEGGEVEKRKFRIAALVNFEVGMQSVSSQLYRPHTTGRAA